MKLFTNSQLVNWDKFTIKNEPISSYDLMERASITLSSWISDKIDISETILILVGNGNNGGDGLAIARLLHNSGYKINIFLTNSLKRSEENKINYNKCLDLDIEFVNTINNNYSIIIDAMFGSGLSRNIEGEFAEIIKIANNISASKIAIDCPSGLHSDQGPLSNIVFKANYTLSLQIPKISFYYKESDPYLGKISILDIGLLKSYYNNEASNFHLIDKTDSLLPIRNKFSHKGSFGHSLTIAGAYGKMGACYLSAKASLRSGCGLSTVLVPSSQLATIQTLVPESMALTYNETSLWSKTVDINSFNSIAIGPGISTQKNIENKLLDLLPTIKIPLVLDADALNIIAKTNTLDLIPINSIITPHPKEFERLFGKFNDTFDMINIQQKMSKLYNIIIVNKLAKTIISDIDGSIYINDTGNSGMASAGSGDVLTGVINGLLSSGLSPIKSAISGVYHHGLAGDKCSEQRGEINMISSDLLDYLFVSV